MVVVMLRLLTEAFLPTAAVAATLLPRPTLKLPMGACLPTVDVVVRLRPRPISRSR
jgi:hypothetical protein